jgi:hypothetical protein
VPIALIDRYDELQSRRLLPKLNDLLRLRHDAVVRSDDEDNDVGDERASSSHPGKGGVTGRVDEGDNSRSRVGWVVGGNGHGEGTDSLGDAAGFAFCDGGFTKGVEERGLAVIDVALSEMERMRRDEN